MSITRGFALTVTPLSVGMVVALIPPWTGALVPSHGKARRVLGRRGKTSTYVEIQMVASSGKSEASSSLRFPPCNLLARPTALFFFTLLLFCFVGSLSAQEDRAAAVLDGATAAGRLPLTDSHALTEAAFYEKDGKLEITDTTLRFGNGAFSMDQARYRARLAAELGEKAPLEYRYEDRLAFTAIGLRWSSANGEKISIAEGGARVTGRLITNGKEVAGEGRSQLAGKGMIYENLY